MVCFRSFNYDKEYSHLHELSHIMSFLSFPPSLALAYALFLSLTHTQTLQQLREKGSGEQPPLSDLWDLSKKISLK